MTLNKQAKHTALTDGFFLTFLKSADLFLLEDLVNPMAEIKTDHFHTGNELW